MRTIISNLRTARMAMMFILALLTTLTVQAAADKTALTTAVSEAETYHSSIQESNPNEAEVLTMIINACKTVLNDADAVQSDVDFAATFMNETVKQCKIAVAQANYAAAISEAEEYLASIKEKYPEQAAKMAAAIDNCKTIESTSQEVLEFFTQVMTDAVKQIKLEVAQANLAAAISEAEEYMGSIQEKHPEQAQKLANAIDNCKVMNTPDASQEVLEVITELMTSAVKQIKLEVAQADLAAAISEAEAYYNSIKDTHPEQAQKLANAIDNCKVMNTPDASLEVLEVITELMTGAVKQIKMEVAHADLAAAISEAETYYNSIQESSPSVASVLQMIIDAAKQVQGDDSYTQSDLEFATAFMQEVLKQAKEAVTTGVASARAATSLATKYYDLQGRRVAQPSRAGVYINNGVKVVSK